MRSDTWDGMDECVDCGARIEAGIGRGYRVTDELALCLSCALKRGGVLDEDYIWTQPPDLTGIDPDTQHKYR